MAYVPPHKRRACALNHGKVLVNKRIVGVQFSTGAAIDSVTFHTRDEERRPVSFGFGGEGGKLAVSASANWADEERAVYIRKISGRGYRERKVDNPAEFVKMFSTSLRIVFYDEGKDEFFREVKCEADYETDLDTWILKKKEKNPNPELFEIYTFEQEFPVGAEIDFVVAPFNNTIPVLACFKPAPP